MVPGGTVLNIEKGQWHSLKCLESGTVLLEAMDGAKRTEGEVMLCSGTVLLEAKDGTFEPLGEDEVMKRGMTLGLGKWGYDVWQ